MAMGETSEGRGRRALGGVLLAVLSLAGGCVDDLNVGTADGCTTCGDAAITDATPIPDERITRDAAADADPGRDMVAPPDAAPDADLADQQVPDLQFLDAELPDLAPLDLDVVDAELPDLALTDDAAFDLGRADAEPADLGPDAEIVSPCPDGRPPRAETCDGTDEDCDGHTDEDFELGSDCQALGRCGQGFVECDDEGSTRCSTEPGASVDQSIPERCNGNDDDCDGLTDENPDSFDVACYDGPAGTVDVGLCESGLRRCVAGALSACAGAVRPREDVCNGDDDDCDGATDEAYVATLVCGAGVCRNNPTPSRCENGAVVACQPGAPTGDDLDCNGIDEDCDGTADEGFAPDGACGVGECRTNATPSHCNAGNFVPCNPGMPQPTDLLCDGLDSDCDGRTDEGYVPNLRCGTGACANAATASRCEAGQEVVCVPGPPTGDDTDCDNIDDDCDGAIDEGFVPEQSCGLGACAAAAVPGRCVVGVVQPCLPGVPGPNDASCNNIDDDCDGRTDEAYVVVGQCGVGVCATTSVPSACQAGVERLCAPGQPGDEGRACNGIDDDCDGATDEGAPQLDGDPLRLTLHQAGALDPAIVAVTGGGFAAVWSDNRPGAQGIYFARLSALGVVTQGPSRLTTFAQGVARNPSISVGPNGTFGVAFVSTAPGAAQVFFVSVTAAGAAAADPVTLLSTVTNAVDPSIVYNGSEFAVAWSDAAYDPPEVVLRRINSAGQPLGQPIRITDIAGAATLPSLVHRGAGNGYAVAYNENNGGVLQAWFQRINVNGQPQGGRFQMNDNQGNANAPRMVALADLTYAATWYDTRDGNAEIYFARLDANGIISGPQVRVTNTPLASTLPSITAAPGGFMLSWTERIAADNDEVFAQRLGPAGGLIGTAVRVSNALGGSYRPAVAHDGTQLGVVWYDRAFGPQDEIVFQRGPLGCAP